MTWLYDSHIHLSDSYYDEDLSLVVERMKKLKIKACCVSMDYSSSLKTLEIAKNSEVILPFIGIHPEKAIEDIAPIADLISKSYNTIAGIGEIGLDPTYISSEKESKNQEMVFRTLLSLAEKFSKPISVHSRKSLDQIFSILPSFDLNGVLLHWFDGNKKQLRKAMDYGYYVSYGPVMVYADDKKSLLSNTHLDKFLVETDGPVPFSKCFELRNAQIDFIPSVIFSASKVLKMSYEETALLLEKNSQKYLGIYV